MALGRSVGRGSDLGDEVTCRKREIAAQGNPEILTFLRGRGGFDFTDDFAVQQRLGLVIDDPGGLLRIENFDRQFVNTLGLKITEPDRETQRHLDDLRTLVDELDLIGGKHAAGHDFVEVEHDTSGDRRGRADHQGGCHDHEASGERAEEGGVPPGPVSACILRDVAGGISRQGHPCERKT